MAFINENYQNLKTSYLFSDIAKRITKFQNENPEKQIIRMGIGDVTLPLSGAVVEALKDASLEMGEKATFHGYGPEQGYAFLRDGIRDYYKNFNVELSVDEIFVGDGAKSDIGNITDLFSDENTILMPDPVYPVYVDSNVMLGRKIEYLNGTSENDFLPLPDFSRHADILYICSPNNPTGAVYTKEQLKVWVDYAIEHSAVILFDAAYESYISDAALPHSIYEIEGAKQCAVEFCSFSKTAGFTGARCGYTVMPHDLTIKNSKGGKTELNSMWLRRQTTKFNGVSYITQRGAAAVFTKEGQSQVKAAVSYYMQNAVALSKLFLEKGIYFTGGVNSPYIWLCCPGGMKSWEFFDYLLNRVAIVGTPGAGFGKNGEGFFRLTAFSSKESTQKAVELLKTIL